MNSRQTGGFRGLSSGENRKLPDHISDTGPDSAGGDCKSWPSPGSVSLISAFLAGNIASSCVNDLSHLADGARLKINDVQSF